MTTIIRCIPLDSRIQIGFYGAGQEVLQQLHERGEGYPLSRRWLSSLLPEIPIGQNETLVFPYKKKYGGFLLDSEIQTVGANSNFPPQIVDEE